MAQQDAQQDARQDAPQEVPAGQPHAQPPPGWPYGDPPAPSRASAPHPEADEPERPRRGPSRRFWYLFGTGLIVLGFVLMIAFIAIAVTQGLRGFSGSVDVAVPGQTQVDLPPGEERMIWARPGDARGCSTQDTAGTDLPLEPSGSVSVSINDDEWVGVGTFPTGNGHVVVECDGDPGVIRIANVFNTWGLVGSILGAVLAPILCGFAGAAILTVTGVRHYRSK